MAAFKLNQEDVDRFAQVVKNFLEQADAAQNTSKECIENVSAMIKSGSYVPRVTGVVENIYGKDQKIYESLLAVVEAVQNYLIQVSEITGIEPRPVQ